MNDYYDPSLKQSRLEILGKYNNFNFHNVDLKDKAAVDSIFETYQPTHVINLAAQAGVRYSVENLGYHSQIIKSGREVNDGMGEFIADKIIKGLIKTGKKVIEAKVVEYGI